MPGPCTWDTSREDCKVCKGVQALQERYQPRAEEHAHAGPTRGASQVTCQGDAGAPRKASWHLSCSVCDYQGLIYVQCYLKHIVDGGFRQEWVDCLRLCEALSCLILVLMGMLHNQGRMLLDDAGWALPSNVWAQCAQEPHCAEPRQTRHLLSLERRQRPPCLPRR